MLVGVVDKDGDEENYYFSVITFGDVLPPTLNYDIKICRKAGELCFFLDTLTTFHISGCL